MTRRTAVGAALGLGLVPGALRAQDGFSVGNFEAGVDRLCKTVDTMADEVAGSAPAPSLEAAVGSMQTMFETLPVIFEWMQRIEDGDIPEPTDAELDRLAAAVRRARDCGERYKDIAEDWARKFGPDLAGSGQGTVDAGGWMRRKVPVDWHWAAVVTLAAVILLRMGQTR